MLLSAKVCISGDDPIGKLEQRSLDELLKELERGILLRNYPFRHAAVSADMDSIDVDDPESTCVIGGLSDSEFQKLLPLLTDRTIYDSNGRCVRIAHVFPEDSDETENRDEFAKFISDFLLVCQIAKPGAFTYTSVEFQVDGKPVRTAFYDIDGVQAVLAAYNAERYGIQPMSTLSIQQVWDWIVKVGNGQESIASSLSHDQVWRAINSLRLALGRHIWYRADPFGDVRIVWTMMGLESLYPIRSRDEVKEFSSEQIANQASSFIQPLTDLSTSDYEIYLELMRRLYDVRSRFFHGQLSFPRPAGLTGYANEFEVPVKLMPSLNSSAANPKNKEMVDVRDLTAFGLSLLIASLQELVRRNAYFVRFNITPPFYFPETHP